MKREWWVGYASAIQLSPNLNHEWWMLPLLVLWGTSRWAGHGFVCRGLPMQPSGDPAAHWNAWDCPEVPPHSEPWPASLQFPTQPGVSPMWSCLPLPHGRCTNWWGQQVRALGNPRINTRFPNACDKDSRAPFWTQSRFPCKPLGAPKGSGCHMLTDKDNGATPSLPVHVPLKCVKIVEICTSKQVHTEFGAVKNF